MLWDAEVKTEIEVVTKIKLYLQFLHDELHDYENAADHAASFYATQSLVSHGQ